MKMNMYASLAVVGLGSVTAAGWNFVQGTAPCAASSAKSTCVTTQSAPSTASAGDVTCATTSVAPAAAGGGTCCTTGSSRAQAIAPAATGGAVASTAPTANTTFSYGYTVSQGAAPTAIVVPQQQPSPAKAPKPPKAPKPAKHAAAAMPAMEGMSAPAQSPDALAERTAALEALLDDDEQVAGELPTPAPGRPSLRRAFRYDGNKLIPLDAEAPHAAEEADEYPALEMPPEHAEAATAQEPAERKARAKVSKRQAERAAQLAERERARAEQEVSGEIESALREAQEEQEEELAEAREELERAMQDFERAQAELHDRMQQSHEQQAELQRRIHEHMQPLLEKHVQGALERAGVELERSARALDDEALEEKVRALEEFSAQHARGAQARAGRTGSVRAQQGTPQPQARGGQASLEDRVAELERRLGLGGGQAGGAPGGVGGRRTPVPDDDCTPERSRIMVAPRNGNRFSGVQTLPEGQLHGHMVLPDGHSFELHLDGNGSHAGSLQLFGTGPDGAKFQVFGRGEGLTLLDEVECDEDCCASDDEDSADDDDEADEDDDEMWEDEDADDDDESDADDDDEDDDSDATTFWKRGDAAYRDYALQLYGAEPTLSGNSLGHLDAARWRSVQPQSFYDVTTASEDQPPQASAQLRAVIDEMRAEVESLRSALGDLRSQVERRKQAQGSALR